MQIQFPGKRKIHYLFADGKEMAEEYDLKTDELIGKQQVFCSAGCNWTLWISLSLTLCLSARRWRHKNALGAVGPWQVEVGEPLAGPDANSSSEVIKENCSNVSFLLCSLKLWTCISLKHTLMIAFRVYVCKINLNSAFPAHIYAQGHKHKFSVENPQPSLPQRCLYCLCGAIWEVYHH